MLKLNKRMAVVALLLVVSLLSGCFGPKTFDITVQIDPKVAGVEIREGSQTGTLLAETNESGMAELKKLKEGTIIVPVKDGYSFDPAEAKVTSSGAYNFMAIPDQETDKKIAAVQSFDDKEYFLGEAPAFDELDLPAKAEVTLDDGSKEELEVEWAAGDYDPAKIGTYTLKGALQLKEGIINPDNIEASIKIIIQETDKKIAAVQSFDDKEYFLGEAPAFDELDLPAKAEVTLDDGSKEELEVEWAAGDYDPAKIGTYTLKGALQLKEGIINPDNIEASIKIIIKETLAIKAVAPQADVKVLIGTPFADLNLPDTVEVTLSDDSKVDLAVEWAEDDYDPDKAGENTLEGVLKLVEGLTNPDGLKAQIKVIVLFVPEDDEPAYQDAQDYLTDLIKPDEPITGDKINLPKTFKLDDGREFTAVWTSSNPAVIDTDGNVTRSAQDETVTLTASLTLKKDIQTQVEGDPRVWSATVTVKADPVKKAEKLVKAVEDFTGPERYAQVSEFETLFEDALKAVEEVPNGLERSELKKRLNIKRGKVDDIYNKRFEAVYDALDLGFDSVLEFFDALQAFWDVERGYLDIYVYLAEKQLLDVVPPSDGLERVNYIQEKIVEKAIDLENDRDVTQAIIKAAKTKDLTEFKKALVEYAGYFERLNLEDQEILKAYMTTIAEIDLRLVLIEDLQKIIDVINALKFAESIVLGFARLDPDRLSVSKSRLPYVSDEYVDKDAVAGLFDDVDLLVDVKAANNEEQLYAALQAADFDYVYVENLKEYLKRLKDLSPFDEDSINGLAKADDPIAEVLEEILSIWTEEIQGTVNGVNQDCVASIVADIVEESKKAEPDADLVEGLLQKLDAVTPILEYGIEVDFDLEDEELDFHRDRMPYYIYWFSEFECASIQDIKWAIEFGNDDCRWDTFDKLVVEVRPTYVQYSQIWFKLKALNKNGKSYWGFDGSSPSAVVEITGCDPMKAVASYEFSGGTAWLVLDNPFYGKEIAEDLVADLTIEVKDDDGKVLYKGTVTTDPFTVDAYPTGVKITTDALEYKTGDTVKVSVELLYSVWTNSGWEDRTVYTFTGEVDGEVLIYDPWFGSGYSEKYNRRFKFEHGVGSVEVPARKMGENLTVEVTFDELDWYAWGMSDEFITITPGDPAKVVADWIFGDIGLKIQDAFDQLTDFTATSVEVELSWAKKATTTAGIMPLGNDPDKEGLAYVDFAAGEGQIKFEGSDFKQLVDEKSAGELVTITVKIMDLGLQTTLDYQTPVAQ